MEATDILADTADAPAPTVQQLKDDAVASGLLSINGSPEIKAELDRLTAAGLRAFVLYNDTFFITSVDSLVEMLVATYPQPEDTVQSVLHERLRDYLRRKL